MKKTTCLLIGYFGYGNLGDEETLRVFSERLRSRGVPYRVLCGGRREQGGGDRVLSVQKAFREKESDISPVPTPRKNESAERKEQGAEERQRTKEERTARVPKKVPAVRNTQEAQEERTTREKRAVQRGKPLALLRAIRECRGVILVGGNLLQSESSVRSLLYYAALLRYAAHLGKPILLFGGGLGGFRGGVSEVVMQKLLPKFSYLGLRSEGDISSSLRFSVEKCKVHFTPDLCFLLPDGIHTGAEGGCEDSEERREDPKGEREDSDRIYETVKDVVFIPRKASVSDICFRRMLDAVRASGRRAVIAVFFPREDGAALSRLAARTGASLVIPRTYEEFSRIAATAECTVCERFHGGVFSLLSHTVCYLRTTSGKCQGLYETVESLAPSGGLLVPFQSYEELLFRLRTMLGTGETRNRTRDENPLARGKTIKNESAPAVPVMATSRADDAEGKSARAGRSEREPAPAITSENDPCRAERRKNATDPPTEAVSTKRSESAPTFTEGDGANEKRKKEIGDKASDFSRVISLLRDKEEEEFTLFLREFSGE